MLVLPSHGFYSNFRYVKLLEQKQKTQKAISHALEPGFSLKSEYLDILYSMNNYGSTIHLK